LDEERLFGNDLEKNKRIEGKRGSARLIETKSADEKRRTKRKSTRVGFEMRK
jgi:hypothetical protein